MVRRPIVAGRFYSADAQSCLRELQACIPEFTPGLDESGELVGGIVPHAGWICSGKVTGKVFRALAERSKPATVVLFGAVHAVSGSRASVYARGCWRTPLGDVSIDEDLADRILKATELAEHNEGPHALEHSLEVQVPFVQRLFPDAMIVPVMVPPVAGAPRMGQAVGEALKSSSSASICVGTTDLTHYGPSYGMTSHGTGQDGLDWAKNENDRRMIERVLAMEPGAIVSEAKARSNACGPGAVAATIAACSALGATRAILLEHTTSQQTVPMPGPVSDAVGYMGVVFG